MILFKLNDSKIGFSIGDTGKTVLIKVDNQKITCQLVNGSVMNMDDFDILFSIIVKNLIIDNIFLHPFFEI